MPNHDTCVYNFTYISWHTIDYSAPFCSTHADVYGYFLYVCICVKPERRLAKQSRIMELILNIIIQGFIIGIVVSAPMGPVGMLVIQRTLYRGRQAGFFSGLGATTSDLLYAILTGLGMTFVIEFIEANQQLLQIAGSLVLIGFGIYLYRQNPAGKIKQGGNSKLSFAQDFVTAFFVTVSNPLIIFLYIGLFARFNSFVSETHILYHLIGYTAIALGAVAWWFFITTAVNKVRRHFNVRSLHLLNRTIGIIILILAVAGLLMGLKGYFL